MGTCQGMARSSKRLCPTETLLLSTRKALNFVENFEFVFIEAETIPFSALSHRLKMSYFTFKSIGIAARINCSRCGNAMDNHCNKPRTGLCGHSICEQCFFAKYTYAKKSPADLDPPALITGAVRLSATNQHSRWGLRLALPLWWLFRYWSNSSGVLIVT